jgi:peptidoglycan/xylan/chitin deacetylase (PgdA/CDA1 family)
MDPLHEPEKLAHELRALVSVVKAGRLFLETCCNVGMQGALRIVVCAAAVVSGLVLSVFGYLLYEKEIFASDFLSYYSGVRKEIAAQPELNAPPVLASGVRVPILVYHSVRPSFIGQTRIQRELDVEPAVFDKELSHLEERGYTVITLDALVDNLTKGTLLPSKPVVLTFDDGWGDQYENALPLLEKHRIKATFFVYTNALGHKHFMTWEQIKDLDARGMTIGAHTKTHPYLPKIVDPARLRDEIIGSKKALEQRLGKEVRLFAYPFGHYNEQIISIVKEVGFAAARSTYVGAVHTKGDLYTLRAIEVPPDFEGFINGLEQDVPRERAPAAPAKDESKPAADAPSQKSPGPG